MWVKLDDKLHSNPKVLEAGDEPLGLYCRALSYCGDHLTDGIVPAYWVVRNTTNKIVARLIELGFWEEIHRGDRRHVTRDTGERLDVVAKADGYFIRDFLKLNPSAAEVQRRRSDRSEAGRKGAQSRWGKTEDRTADFRGKHDKRHSKRLATAIADPLADGTAPDPTRPQDLSPPTPSPRKPGAARTPPAEKRAPFVCRFCKTERRTEQQLREHLTHAHWPDLEPGEGIDPT